MGFLVWLAKLFTGDIVGRAFDVIDKKIEGENDRERLKAEVTQTWLRNRMHLPWWLDAVFIVPLGLWWVSIIIYSILFHVNGPFPVSWDIAALPAPLDQWAGWIILSRFGAGIVGKFVK